MRKIIIIIIMLAVAYQITAQCGNAFTQPPCNPAIPFDAIVIDATTTLNGVNFGCYWLCSRDTLILDGVANLQVYGEEFSVISLLGGENFIWAMEGSEVTVETGSNFNFIRREPATTLVDNGSLTMDSVCTTLIFDKTNAPANGCAATSTIVKIVDEVSIHSFPNPSSGRLNVSIDERLVGGTAVMFDASGKKVLRLNEIAQPILELELIGLRPGNYVMEIRKESLRASQKILFIY